MGKKACPPYEQEGVNAATPTERQQDRADAKQTQAENTIDNDATVQAIVEAFNGQVKPGSVQPTE